MCLKIAVRYNLINSALIMLLQKCLGCDLCHETTATGRNTEGHFHEDSDASLPDLNICCSCNNYGGRTPKVGV